MARKGLIAITIIIIVVVGGLGWYFLFGQPEETQTIVKMLYVDGKAYNTTQINLNVNATPSATLYSLHNITNPTNNTETAFFNYTVAFFNASQSAWVQIYDGSEWLIKDSNLTASLVYSIGNLPTLMITPFEKPFGDKATYHVYTSFTDQIITMKFEYTGTQPTVDGQTVFTYLAFDGNANGIFDPGERAFNFTNNPARESANMVQEFEPMNSTAWNNTAIKSYSWSGTNMPSDMPVSVSITEDRKNVTWTIPYGAIGASKDSFVGVVIQAFGYDFYPQVPGMPSTVPPMPNSYKILDCRFTPPPVAFQFIIQPQTTIKFYVKVVFTADAVRDTQYAFTLSATI